MIHLEYAPCFYTRYLGKPFITLSEMASIYSVYQFTIKVTRYFSRGFVIGNVPLKLSRSSSKTGKMSIKFRKICSMEYTLADKSPQLQ